MRNEDIFEKAVEALKNEDTPSGPPRELVDATIASLAEASEQSDTVNFEKRIRIRDKLLTGNRLARIAAAAVLLIAAGYATGRFSAPPQPDVEQLRAALEPVISRNVADQMRQYLQLGLANSYIQLRGDLSEQCRQDFNRFAMQTLAASNSVTNELLTEFVKSINDSQTQDWRRIGAALEQIELNRRRDSAQLSNAFAALAVQTEDELMRTKRDVAELLSYTQPDGLDPSQSGNEENQNKIY